MLMTGRENLDWRGFSRQAVGSHAHAQVAQGLERVTDNDEVGGSIPPLRTKVTDLSAVACKAKAG